MAKVNIIYHYFPHYRRPVMRELVKSGHHEYRFWGSLDDHKGIRAYKGDDLVQISPISFSCSRQQLDPERVLAGCVRPLGRCHHSAWPS